jgi:hypothetical protein
MPSSASAAGRQRPLQQLGADPLFQGAVVSRLLTAFARLHFLDWVLNASIRVGVELLTPPALDQRVVEHRGVVVLARDRDDLVPNPRIVDALAVHLRSEALLVDRG